MAIQQTKHTSDLEKRLKLLRRQVYGKYQLAASERGEPAANHSSDLTYLRHDLIKILIFASLAIGLQVVLKFFERR